MQFIVAPLKGSQAKLKRSDDDIDVCFAESIVIL